MFSREVRRVTRRRSSTLLAFISVLPTLVVAWSKVASSQEWTANDGVPLDYQVSVVTGSYSADYLLPLPRRHDQAKDQALPLRKGGVIRVLPINKIAECDPGRSWVFTFPTPLEQQIKQLWKH
uniref:Uncharacterized protein n=1 Tax=Timema poppense TaxID=170557 RepID=A0A7R9DGS5_TIMPO|nr:unnamed protein product [Timema poppensis]